MVLGDIELLQLPQGAEGLLMDLGDLVVHQDESLGQGGVGSEGTTSLPPLCPHLFLPPLPLELELVISGATSEALGLSDSVLCLWLLTSTHVTCDLGHSQQAHLQTSRPQDSKGPQSPHA